MEFSLEMLFAALKPLLDIYAGKLGFLPQLLSIVGTLRLFIKPVLSLVRTYVSSTASLEDDAKLDKVEASGLFKGFMYVIDWFASYKVK